MAEYCPTDIALTLASMQRDAAYISADIADAKLNEQELTYDCREQGITLREFEQKEARESADETEALLRDIGQISIDPNSEYEEVMKLATTSKKKISIDELMGVGNDADDARIIEELAEELEKCEDNCE